MIAVFVLIDALGWELIRDRRFLSRILPYRRELTTVFGFSSGAIPSILTGMLPRDHEHWNLFVYDPPHSPFAWARFLGRLPTRWANHRVTRKAVSVLSRKLSRARGYFQLYGVPVEILPLFDICEKEDIYKPGGLSPKQSVFDLLQARNVLYRAYSYHDYSDGAAVDQAVRDIQERSARFYFVYLSELDNFLHRYIGDGAKVDAELARYERYVERIYEAALVAGSEASFYVFSDHGMTPVSGTFDLMGAIEALGLKVPLDYVALYDATMARFWFFRDEARRRITEHLSSLECGQVIGPERAALGIDFGHNRFGDLIFLMNEGCLMHPSHMGRVPWPGMHGFHPAAPSSSACLLARREPPLPVSHIRDVFELMCLEAGIG